MPSARLYTACPLLASVHQSCTPLLPPQSSHIHAHCAVSLVRLTLILLLPQQTAARHLCWVLARVSSVAGSFSTSGSHLAFRMPHLEAQPRPASGEDRERQDEAHSITEVGSGVEVGLDEVGHSSSSSCSEVACSCAHCTCTCHPRVLPNMYTSQLNTSSQRADSDISAPL